MLRSCFGKTIVMKYFFALAASLFTLLLHAQKDSSDAFIVQQVKANGYAVRTARAIVWFSPRVKDRQKAQAFAEALNQGIEQIEELTGQVFDTAYYSSSRIEYFVSEYTTVSHVYNGYRHNSGERLPYIFFSAKRFVAGAVPYLHETTHLILRSFQSLWLREGMAEWVAMQVGKSSGRHVAFYATDDHSNELPALLNDAASHHAVQLIGLDGIPSFESTEDRRRFYAFSTSFVQYLATFLGKEQLLELYFAPSTRKRLEEISGRSLEALKEAWKTWAMQSKT